jgi:hypothetical protein
MKTSRDFPREFVDWDLFVMRHQNKKNVVVHFFSFLFFWFSPVLAYFSSPWWMIAFFSSGLMGTFGHYLFKDGTIDVREATSSLKVVQFSSKMAFLVATGKYWKEIEYVNKKWIQYKNNEVGCSIDPVFFLKIGKHS